MISKIKRWVLIISMVNEVVAIIKAYLEDMEEIEDEKK